MTIDKNALLLGRKDDDINVQNNREKITFSSVKLQKLLENIILLFCFY